MHCFNGCQTVFSNLHSSCLLLHNGLCPRFFAIVQQKGWWKGINQSIFIGHIALDDLFIALTYSQFFKFSNDIAALRKLTNEVGAQIQSQEKASLIQENVGKVNKEFNDNLIKAFPTLTKAEMELCGLFRLNLTNKEIGIIKNILRNRLRWPGTGLGKKFRLKPADDIYKFLASFYIVLLTIPWRKSSIE